MMSDPFSCSNCNQSLYGQKYVRVEEKPLCVRCYERLYANTCHQCKELIGHHEKVRPDPAVVAPPPYSSSALR